MAELLPGFQEQGGRLSYFLPCSGNVSPPGQLSPSGQGHHGFCPTMTEPSTLKSATKGWGCSTR
jgi:hypothetical protein